MPKKENSCSTKLAEKNTKSGQSDQVITNLKIIELHLKKLKGRPDLLKPIHLQCIGSWYYHKYPTRSFFHSNHNHAEDLLNVKTKTDRPIELWKKLTSLIARLRTNGQLSSKILEVYNSAFIEYGCRKGLGMLKVRTYIGGQNPILKTPSIISREMEDNINKCENCILSDLKRQPIPLLTRQPKQLSSALPTIEEEKTNEKKMPAPNRPYP